MSLEALSTGTTTVTYLTLKEKRYLAESTSSNNGLGRLCIVLGCEFGVVAKTY